MKMIQLTMQITAKEITKITLGKYVDLYLQYNKNFNLQVLIWVFLDLDLSI